MTTDVNQELFAQRRAAIGSGNVTRRDDGTWGYADKKEVFGKEGLDMTTGQAALYSSVPAWHSLGNIVPGGITDIDKVMELGGIAFDVDAVPAEYLIDGVHRTVPDTFVNVRSDTGAAIGVVGKRYERIQNRTGFEFLQDLTANYDVPWESAGALRDGRKTFVSMLLPETVHIEAVDDRFVLFIVALNSHDGSSSMQVVVTPWRIVCANTERFALADAAARWGVRHTKNVGDRLAEARRTLGLTLDYVEQFKNDEEALAQQTLYIDEFNSFLVDHLWTPADSDASPQAITRMNNRRDKLNALRDEPRNFPGTAYGAERTITEFLDHPNRLSGKNAEQATRVIEGADDEKKSQAHARLMTLVNR